MASVTELIAQADAAPRGTVTEIPGLGKVVSMGDGTTMSYNKYVAQYGTPTGGGGAPITSQPANTVQTPRGAISTLPTPGYTPPTSSSITPGGTPQTGNGGTAVAANVDPNSAAYGYDILPGYQWEVDELNREQQTALQAADNRAAMDRLERQYALEMEQQRINNEFAARQAQLERDFTGQQAEADRQLQVDLTERRITVEEYLQQRSLAQQESQFARDLAFRELEMEKQQAIETARIEIDRAAEIRMERELRANLSANPQDFVAYQMYMRDLGSADAYNQALSFAQGGTATPAPGGDANALTLDGGGYPDSAPAYDDATMQTLVQSFFGNEGNLGQEPLYNPALQGAGVFGTQIERPNSISRREGVQLSDTELGLLSSFLKGGIDMGNGQRTSINPQDYFKQVENSWVPTFSSIGSSQSTRYE